MRRAGADSAIMLSVAPSLCPSVGMIPKIRFYTQGQLRRLRLLAPFSPTRYAGFLAPRRQRERSRPYWRWPRRR
jgi:hypothetical protein